MKRLLFLVLLIAIGISAAVVYGRAQTPSPPSPTREVKSAEIVARNATPTVTPGLPIFIEIPRLSVKAEVEHVGKDETGAMDIPTDWMNAAWYNRGPRPGEIGNAVIAAHYDTPSGEPSVFFALSSLSPNDEIRITDEDDTIHVYRVTEVADYPTDEFPLTKVFGDSTKPRLNLITCGGIFDTETNNYLSRTVVYSELTETIPPAH